MSSRRKFIKQLSAASVALPLASLANDKIARQTIPWEKKISSNDKINAGIIGFGIMGSRNLKTILQIPGIELKAVCDLYKGRLERAKELYGAQLFTTQDYEELLSRSDIDAVVICTSDQWHDRISIDAMKKGKAVYCEKPMVHQLSQGWEVIKVQQQTKAIFQVGSQRVEGGDVIAVLEPDLGFLDVHPDPDDQEGRQDPDHQQAAPADIVVEQAVDRARHQEADAPRPLHHRAHEAARARRP